MASKTKSGGRSARNAAKKKVSDSLSVVESTVRENDSDDPIGFIRTTDRFALLNHLIARDLNNNLHQPTFSRYTKDEIQKYISNPYKFEKQLRRAVIYLYGASSHFRRLIQYFVGLSDLSYFVAPYRIDPKSANAKTTNRNYRRVLNTLSAMSIKTQFPKILTVCLREDTFFGTLWITSDNITIQQLPSDYCSISTVEGNVFNVTFNFSYFDTHKDMLPYYPEEFRTKYAMYQNSRSEKWIELNSPTSFAIKCNNDIMEYSMPPFAGILREVYDLEDYKSLKLTRAALENYAMICMKIPLNSDGSWGIDLKKAKEFWRNLDNILPEEVGSILSPMDISKISFEKSNTDNTDTIADAEQNLFTAAGVSSLLFNNEKASANSLALSIKVDQEITFGIVKSIEDMVNRFIQAQSYGKNFKVNFLNVSTFNRKEVGDQYLKAAQYGLPTVMMYAASQGLNQAEMDTMKFLENDVLNLKESLIPLMSSTTMSSSDINATSSENEQGGRPEKDATELTDSGEQSHEDKDDWG